MATTIGDKVRTKRQSMRLTQKALSDLSGVPQGYLSQIERGDRSPSLKSLQKLRAALCVPDTEFIAWVDVT